jgi:hypothetical protein
MWEAIKLAKMKGCETFDFGRTSVHNRPLSEYKSRWGATASPLHYVRLPVRGPQERLDVESEKYALLKAVLKSSPAWIVRLTGEAFYRHFA